jgi:hypothetical protein
MTNEEALALISSCKNRDELIKKLGGTGKNRENMITYLVPLRQQLGITPKQLTSLFKK